MLDIILKDAKDFDPKTWLYAVSLSVSALIVLGLTMCILLLRDQYLEWEEKRLRGKFSSVQSFVIVFVILFLQSFHLFIRCFSLEEDEWGSIGIIPNIILNPNFLEPDDPNDPSPPYTRTIIFGEDVLSTSESDSDEEEPISFKRKFSLFFTGDTIKRL